MHAKPGPVRYFRKIQYNIIKLYVHALKRAEKFPNPRISRWHENFFLECSFFRKRNQ